MPQARPAELYNIKFRAGCKSRRLFASSAYASACTLRQSANAKGTPDSLSSVGVFIFKTTSFTNAPRLLCDVFLDFPSARLTAAERRYMVAQSAKPSFASIVSHIFRAGCRSAVRAFPCADIDRARTPKELRTACPPLAFLYSRQHHSQNAPRLLCDVFLDFRSRSARSRSATFRRSSARQSTCRLPHRALCYASPEEGSLT